MYLTYIIKLIAYRLMFRPCTSYVLWWSTHVSDIINPGFLFTGNSFWQDLTNFFDCSISDWTMLDDTCVYCERTSVWFHSTNDTIQQHGTYLSSFYDLFLVDLGFDFNPAINSNHAVEFFLMIFNCQFFCESTSFWSSFNLFTTVVS